MIKPTLIMIGGPTASGKSARAMEIAQQENSVIINADAMQVYRDLPILTAQPAAQDKAAVPHALYEVFDPAEKSSAGKWLVLAEQEIRSCQAKGKTPILVGGTGLYFKALMEGLADIPPIPEEIRLKAQNHYEKLGSESFRADLAKLDVGSAKSIKPNDRQRLIRAYEVALHTGKPLSYWQNKNKGKEIGILFHVKQIFINPPRAELYAACDRRFEQMIKRGALDEVHALLARNLSPELPAMKVLGVRELAAHLRGECSLDEAISKAQQMTRNYAKRQVTWFKNQWGAN